MDEPYIVIDYKIHHNVVERHVITYDKATDTIIDDYSQYDNNIYTDTHFTVESAVQKILKCLPPIYILSYNQSIDICDTDPYMNTIETFQLPHGEYHEWQGYISMNNSIIYSISAQLNTSTYNYICNCLKQLLYMLIRV